MQYRTQQFIIALHCSRSQFIIPDYIKSIWILLNVCNRDGENESLVYCRKLLIRSDFFSIQYFRLKRNKSRKIRRRCRKIWKTVNDQFMRF